MPLIYAAAGDASLWIAVLEQFTIAMNTRKGFFLINGIGSAQPVVAATFGVPPDILAAISQPDYRDPWMSRVDLGTVPFGTILRSNEICPDEILITDPWYQKLCLPMDSHYGGGVILERSADVFAVMTTNRGRSAGPLTDAELSLWRFLVPHFQASIRLFAQQSKLTTERDAMMRYFDDLGHGVVLVSASSEVAAINSRAQAMLERGEGIGIEDRQLRALDAGCDKKLKRAIYLTGGQTERKPERLRLKRKAPMAPLLANLLPLGRPGESQIAPNSATAVIYLVDPQLPHEIDPAPLCELLSFTEAEARLACRLASGDSLAAAAAHLKVSINTVRSHLQKALSKAGVNRQAELVLLVLKIGQKAH
ncbi:MAG: helix-turn-helix transcriptional regulator [Acidobacteriota bacterium]